MDNFGHITNPDGKIAPRAIWLVKGKHIYTDPSMKASNHAMTFDNKDAALACAKNWKLNCKDDKVEVFKTEVTWEKFEPSAKADKTLFEKLEIK